MAIITALIILGVLLLIAEIVVIPGFGVAGIAGIASIITGIVIAYNDFGETTGHITILSATILCAVALFYSLRSKTWKRISLNKNIDSTVNMSPESKNIKIGDEGITITRLAPTGKVRINGIELEARSILEFINHNTDIVVVKFEDSKVIVKEKEKKIT